MIDSEFACEIVRIHQLLPHPNADKLVLAKIEMKLSSSLLGADSAVAGYTVVVRKGDYQVGDLAVYVSVDGVVPLQGPESERWAFLRDSKGQKVSHRIRAARLRGVYSEGILSPLAEHEPDVLGVDMQTSWRIGKYKTKAEQQVPGIPGMKKRPTKLDHLVPQYSLTSLKKAPFLFENGEQVRMTEKIHGTNFRFGRVKTGWFGHEFVVGSHRTWKQGGKSWWKRLLGWGDTNPGYYGEDVWLAATQLYQLFERTRDYVGVVFYGELFGKTASGKHIQDLQYGGGILGLRLFDAYDTRTGVWFNSDQLAVAAADMGLSVAPELYRGPFSMEVARDLAEGTTTVAHGVLADNHTREGVVVEALTGDRRKGKFVGEGYLTRKEE